MTIIEFFQQFDSPTLYLVMRSISLLGDEPFYWFLLPTLFWCWDKKKVLPLVLVLSLEFYINFFLKETFHIPRPEGLALINVEGFGFPSGHAQNAVVLWGYLAWITGKNFWLYGLVILLIGVSRLYLGVHFPSDVIGGWTLGFVWLFICLTIINQLKGRRLSLPTVPAICLVLLLSLWQVSFYQSDLSIKISGGLFGFLAGAFIERVSVQYDYRTSVVKQVIKIFVGMAGMIVIKMGLEAIFPQWVVFHYLGYACIGGWISLGAPWMFVKVGLGENSKN